MAITYAEFDATPATIISALKTNILANPDWSDQGVTVLNTTVSIATTSSGTIINLASTAGLAPGQWLIVNPGATEVYRQITTINSATQVGIVGTVGSIYAIGTTVRTRATVLRTTTDSGAAMIIDLEGGDFTTNGLGIAMYRQYTGTDPGGFADPSMFGLFWKTAVMPSTSPIHVILSAGKNHLFISVEGPRQFESGTTSATYGSVRNYFAASDLVRYHAGDTVPTVIGIGAPIFSAQTSVNSGFHQAQISRDSTDTHSWRPGRLATLDWPTIGSTDVVTPNRDCAIDDSTYLLPYVLFSEFEGIRGRLSHFFYGCSNAPTPITDIPDPVNSKVAYNGVVYKMLAVNKGDGSSAAWGPFGSALNSSSIPLRSVIVAVPFAAEV